MALGSQPRWTVRPAGGVQADIDVGLRDYMLRIYNYMASALVLTGIVAYMAAAGGADSFIAHIYRTPLMWLVILAPLGFVLVLSYGINRMQFGTAQAVFWAFAVFMGLSISTIFLRYTGESIARVFFISAGTFAGMSIYGYTTRRDLSGIGSFLYMGLWGLIIAMVVNVFLLSSAVQFAISVIGVLVFVGLTAYDTQRLREMYYSYQSADGQTAGKMAIMGALSLYLDFINLFMFLLQLFGGRRD